MYMCFYL